MPSAAWRCGVALLAVLFGSLQLNCVYAAEITLTGFGTLGYAQSDEDFRYVRYIDDDGTLKADSLLGVQGELQFDTRWSATVQAVASAPRRRDHGVEAKIRWAFLAYRPTNDWLLRAGRVRIPFFIHTQNAEVGVTYDQARLPVEVYSVSPIYDFDGAAVSKTWSGANSELTIDAFWGRTDISVRLFGRDSEQPTYIPAKVNARGVVLTYASESLTLRGGLHRASIRFDGALAPIESYDAADPFFPAPPPFGGTLFVPTGFAPRSYLNFLTLGVDWRPDPVRITAEYVRRDNPKIHDTGASDGAYVTFAYRWRNWTPYATYARLLSESRTRNLYQTLDSTPVPLLAEGAPLFLPPGYHRMLADQALVYDQSSIMLGAAYSFSATSKLKFEWMHTRIGLRSVLVDGDVRGKSFNVFSASYSIAF